MQMTGLQSEQEARRSGEGGLRAATLLGGSLIAVLAALVLPWSAVADTYTVTEPGEGSESLRSMIAAANSNPGPDTVEFADDLGPTVTVEPNDRGPIPITSRLKITGPGGEAGSDPQLTITGTGGPALHVGATAQSSISNLRFSRLGAPNVEGGAIRNEGTLALAATVFDHNTALNGGAIWNGRALLIADSSFTQNEARGHVEVGGGAIHNVGTTRIVRSSLVGNVARAEGTPDPDSEPYEGNDAFGGAIANGYGATRMVISKSKLARNRSLASSGDNPGSAFGGAIANGQGTSLAIRRSTLNRNQARAAVSAHGGAVHNDASELGITDSTLRANGAQAAREAQGGAVRNSDSGDAVIRNSTFSRNLVTAPPQRPPGAGELGGGAISSGAYRSKLRVQSSTLVGNAAIAFPVSDRPGRIGVGGGILIGTAETDSRVLNSTLSSNVAKSGANLASSTTFGGETQLRGTILTNPLTPAGKKVASCAELYGEIASLGYNLESGRSCGLDATGDQRRTDPDLGRLRDNGGPTKTMAIGLRSPALDAGNADAKTDQRGRRRPVRTPGVRKPKGGDRSDIGAFELQWGKGGARRILGKVRPHRVEARHRSCVVLKAKWRNQRGRGGRLKGVRVRLAGEKARTGRRGRARICTRFGHPGKRVARFHKRGFRSDRAKIKVRRK